MKNDKLANPHVFQGYGASTGTMNLVEEILIVEFWKLIPK
jgi:hypothetical protein